MPFVEEMNSLELGEYIRQLAAEGELSLDHQGVVIIIAALELANPLVTLNAMACQRARILERVFAYTALETVFARVINLLEGDN